MKVLLVDLETAWRGGQNQALLILRGLQARSHDAELVAAQNSELGKRAAQLGIPVHFVSRGFFRLSSAQALRDLLRKMQFDVIHANEAHAVSAVWLARAHRRMPFIISRRVGYPIGKSRFARSRYAAACRIVANSHWVAAQAEASGVPKHLLTVVHEGTEIPPRFTVDQRLSARERWKIPADAPLLGCVGVLLPDKGQEWLIRALAQVRQTFPQARLLLAGDGLCRSKLESLAVELGLRDAVIFAGFVADIASVYAALDVFLLPSFFEALNNSLLAAMAYEIPSIAFQRGALGEIMEDGKSGLLVSGPNVEEIRDAILRILQDRDLAKRLSAGARKRVEENFSAEKMVDGMLRVYQEALQSNAPR